MAKATQEFLTSHPVVDTAQDEQTNESNDIDLLEARDFFATHMSQSALSVSVPLMALFRSLAETCKSKFVEQGSSELGDMVEHILAAVDEAFKPCWVTAILQYVDNGSNATEMGVLFPMASSHSSAGVDNEHAVQVLQLRTSIIYNLLHELTLATPHKVLISLTDIGSGYPLEVAAKETTLNTLRNANGSGQHCGCLLG